MGQTTPRLRPGPEGTKDAASTGPPLAGGVTVVCSDVEVSFPPGAYFLGRRADCDLVFDDPLVSRKHAKVTVKPQDVVLTDLQSANGIFVNGARIHRPTRLHDGDRVLVGTKEISVFAFTPSEEETGDRPTLDIGEPQVSEAGLATPSEPPPSSDAQKSVLTERADAFRFVGRLADKMLALGKNAEAERVLFDHMTKVLHGARAGLPIPGEVLEAAGIYAMRLARATRRGVWIDYAVELHACARTTMSEPVVAALARAVQEVASLDRQLYRGYLDLLRGQTAEMTPAEQQLANRLECMPMPGEPDEDTLT